MRAIVIANGHIANSARRIQTWPHDLVICADGGAQHALALGLPPDVVTGDLDSLDDELQTQLEGKNCQVIVHPTQMSRYHIFPPELPGRFHLAATHANLHRSRPGAC